MPYLYYIQKRQALQPAFLCVSQYYLGDREFYLFNSACIVKLTMFQHAYQTENEN